MIVKEANYRKERYDDLKLFFGLIGPKGRFNPALSHNAKPEPFGCGVFNAQRFGEIMKYAACLICLFLFMPFPVSADPRKPIFPQPYLAQTPGSNYYGTSHSGVAPSTAVPPSPTVHVLPPPRSAHTGGVND